EAARVSVGSLEDYYRDLAMVLTIAPVNRSTLARASQLTQKTNQFNVTTQRYSEAEVAKRMSDSSWLTATVAVKDRFRHNGIVGVIMALNDGLSIDVDTLLLSCRVIGRTVETAMLAWLCDEACKQGAQTITARVVPTKKNTPARDVFERHAFSKVHEDAAGATFWRLDLETGGVDWPMWFARA